MIELNPNELDYRYMALHAKYVTQGNSPALIKNIEELAESGQPNAIAMWYEIKGDSNENENIDRVVMSYENRELVPSAETKKYTEYRDILNINGRTNNNLSPTQFLALTRFYESRGDQISADFYRKRAVHSYIQVGEQSGNPLFYQNAYSLLRDFDDEFLHNNNSRLKNIRRDLSRAYKERPYDARLQYFMGMNLINFDKYIQSILNLNNGHDKGMKILKDLVAQQIPDTDTELAD